MKPLFKNIQTLLIVVLILIILFLRNCSKTPNPTPNPDSQVVVVRVETKWDTIEKIVPTYVPQWRTKTEYRDTILYKDVDTVEILKDYFAAYVYSDTLYNDSINIRIQDTITQNMIVSRSIEYDLIYPTITITRDSIVNDRGFYLGIGVGGSTSQLNYIGGEFLFKSRKKTAFGLGIGVNQGFQPVLMGKLYWKLGK